MSGYRRFMFRKESEQWAAEGEPCPDVALPLARAQRCLNSARGRIRNARVRAALLLRRSRPSGSEERLLAEARTFARSVPVPVRLQVCVSLDGAAAYVYGWINFQALSAQRAQGTRRLAPLAEWRGASPGAGGPDPSVAGAGNPGGWGGGVNPLDGTPHKPRAAPRAGTREFPRPRRP